MSNAAEMDAQEIINYIATAPKKTPVKLYVREKPGMKVQWGNAHVYGGRRGKTVFGDWDELKAIARDSLDAARKSLCDLLCNYQGYRKCHVILVFDAYKVKGGQGSVEKYHNIHVVYTREAETADAYIERATYEIGREHRVKVATSDGPEQLIILGHGALRLSATAFRQEVEQVQGEIAAALDKNNRPEKTGAVRAAMEKAAGPERSQT